MVRGKFKDKPSGCRLFSTLEEMGYDWKTGRMDHAFMNVVQSREALPHLVKASIKLDAKGECRQCSIDTPSDQWKRSTDIPAINPAYSGRGILTLMPKRARKRKFVGEPIFVAREGTEDDDGYILVVENVRILCSSTTCSCKEPPLSGLSEKITYSESLMILFQVGALDKDYLTSWGRISYKPPIYDINAPDLYIPRIAFGTYIIIAGFLYGLLGKFTPEALTLQFTRGLVGWFIQVALLKGMLYTLGVARRRSLILWLTVVMPLRGSPWAY